MWSFLKNLKNKNKNTQTHYFLVPHVQSSRTAVVGVAAVTAVTLGTVGGRGRQGAGVEPDRQAQTFDWSAKESQTYRSAKCKHTYRSAKCKHNQTM